MADNKKQQQKVIEQPIDLDKALGKSQAQPEAKVAQAQPEAKANQPEAKANQPEAKVAKTSQELELDRLIKGITSKANLDTLTKSPTPEFKLEMAKLMFKIEHPNGMIAEFKDKVAEAIANIAQDCMVELDGMEVLARFPNGQGTVRTTEFETVGTYNAKPEGKKSGNKVGKSSYGECTITDDNGKVKAYDNPTQMAKSLGLRITGHTNQVDTFKHPREAVGLSWEDKYNAEREITVVSGDSDKPEAGIHIKVTGTI
jgi:hypothetical protein